MKQPLPIRWAQKSGLFIALLYLGIYIPLAGVTYFPFWYETNCHFHNGCQRFGEEKAVQRIHELTAFMRHTGELAHADWTQKEKWHLAEVRLIFDRLFFAALGAILACLLLFHRDGLRQSSMASMVLIACCAGVLPFFDYFWKDIFHGYLFDNTFWKNNPADVSYYIMPRVFFKYTMMLIIGAALLLNTGVFLLTRAKGKTWAQGR